VHELAHLRPFTCICATVCCSDRRLRSYLPSRSSPEMRPANQMGLHGAWWQDSHPMYISKGLHRSAPPPRWHLRAVLCVGICWVLPFCPCSGALPLLGLTPFLCSSMPTDKSPCVGSVQAQCAEADGAAVCEVLIRVLCPFRSPKVCQKCLRFASQAHLKKRKRHVL